MMDVLPSACMCIYLYIYIICIDLYETSWIKQRKWCSRPSHVKYCISGRLGCCRQICRKPIVCKLAGQVWDKPATLNGYTDYKQLTYSPPKVCLAPPVARIIHCWSYGFHYNSSSKVPPHSNLNPQCNFHVQATVLPTSAINFSTSEFMSKNKFIFKGPDFSSLQHSSASTRASIDFPTSARSCGRSRYLSVQKFKQLKPFQVLHIYYEIIAAYLPYLPKRDFNSIPEKKSIPKNLYLAEFPINQASEYHHKIAQKSANNCKIWAKAMGPRLICIDLKAPPQISPVLSVLSKDQSMTHRQRTAKMVRTLTSIYVINIYIYIS